MKNNYTPTYMKASKLLLVLWMSIICLCAFGQQSLNDSISGQVPELIEEGSGWDFGNWRENIILSVIGGLIVSLIGLVLAKLMKKLRSLKDRIGEIDKRIKNGEDPSKTEKKIDRLEKDIIESKKIPKEEKDYLSNSLADLRKSNSILFFKRGCKRLHETKPNKALEYFDQAVQTNPNYAEALCYRGIVKTLLGDHQGSLDDFTKAIKLRPDYIEAFQKRGELKEEMGDLKGSKKDFAYAFFHIGWKKYKEGKSKDAIKDFDEAIRLNPDFAKAYYDRGNVKYYMKDLQGAIGDYNKVIKLKPDFAEAYFNRGLAKQELMDMKGALEDYNKVIELKPNSIGAYYNRGIAKRINKDPQGALDDFNLVMLKHIMAVAMFILI